MAEYFIEAEMIRADVSAVKTEAVAASTIKKSPEMALLRWYTAVLLHTMT
jgi:hypothetical protein